MIGAGAGAGLNPNNELYIETSDGDETPLIWGHFTDDLLRFNAKVGVNTDPDMRLHVLHGAGDDSHGLKIENSGANHSDWHFYVNNTTGNLKLYQNGSYMGQFSDADGAYSNISDRRLKESISKIPDVLAKVKKLEVVDYYFKNNMEKDTKSLGLIAQDVEKIFPSLVSKPMDDTNDGTSYYTMDYSGFGVIAIKAIQEQQIQLEEQNNKIDKQNQKIETLEKQIQELKDLIQSK